MLTRRRFLSASAGVAALPHIASLGCARSFFRRPPVLVNDVHTALNATPVRGIVRPESCDALLGAVQAAVREGRALAVCGGRHAAGGQQFLRDELLLDCGGLDRVLDFDRERGLLDVEAGIQWRKLIDDYNRLQGDGGPQWAIAAKQTGTDSLSLGGAVSANIHGRALALAPFAAQVESLRLIDPRGELIACSRAEHPELFRRVCGGYGLFGLIYSVRLRLVPRRRLRRVVVLADADALCQTIEARIAAGFLYGDFQFDVDERSEGFLRRGILSCYEPVDDATPIPEQRVELSTQAWDQLITLAHRDKARAYDQYAQFYLKTEGQIYWSDRMQLTTYGEDYHQRLQLHQAGHAASEVITELYVPRPKLAEFLAGCAAYLREHGDNLIYGTIRFIEPDSETALPWARERYACVIFNLHTEHTPAAIEQTAEAMRALIDRAHAAGGSYYLTYHRYATPRQVEACHPGIREFFEAKQRHDPQGLLQSDWYRAYAPAFGA